MHPILKQIKADIMNMDKLQLFVFIINIFFILFIIYNQYTLIEQI
jgi:hypothetical protein